MKSDTTISKVSLMGMLAVSWISILVLGGAWIVHSHLEFEADSEQLRAEHYVSQRAIIKAEVEKAVARVDAIRMAGLKALRHDLRDRVQVAEVLARVLAERVKSGMTDQDIRAVLAAMAAAEDMHADGLYEVRDETVYLFPSFPDLIGKRAVLDRIEDVFADEQSGERKIVFDLGGLGRCTMLVMVGEIDTPAVRIITGACLEVTENDTKAEAIKWLESVRYGGGETLFAGTWGGLALVGPSKGNNMWNVSDSAGSKVVQELVATSRSGGGFVSYVMPPFKGQRYTDKVSYVMAVEDWGWYIGTGRYVDDIESVVAENRKRLERDSTYLVWSIAGWLVFLGVVVFAFSHRIARKMQANILSFTNVWNKALTSGVELDPLTLHYREFKELAGAANLMATEHRAVQDALAESVDSYKTLVSNVPGIVYNCINDSEWTMKYLSETVLEMTGYPASDFIGNAVRSYSSIIHSADRAWVIEAIGDEVRRHRPFTFEYRIVRADGELRWLFERGKARYDDDGNAVLLDGVIFDITDRKQAKDDYYGHLHFLETMERVDRDLRSSVDMETILFDALETIRRSFDSDRAWLLYPCNPQSPTYRVPMERTSPECPGALALGQDVPMFEDTKSIFIAALESSDPVAFDPSTGRELSVDVTEPFGVRSQLVIAIYPRLGEPWMLGLHQCRDARIWSPDELRLFKEVSRRIADALSNLLILKELQESEEKFRTFAEQAMLGICVVQDSRVIFVNQAYCDIFEMSVKDMQAMPFDDFIEFVHPDDREYFLEQKQERLADGSDVISFCVWRALTSTGRIRWVEMHSRTIQVDGRNAGLVSMVDITEKKQARENLEQMIAERTQAVAHKAQELEKAYTRLMRLDELKSSFLTTVSHDLRTPLTSVLGYAKLIRKDLEKALGGAENRCISGQARIVGNLNVMEAEGQRLTKLIDGFLDLTAIEAGAVQWHDKIISIENCIARVVESVEARLAGKEGVHLVVDVAESLPEMLIDQARFEQLLGNILDNAITFTHEGQITLRVKSPTGFGLEITVIDTGKGVPEEELEAVFDVFHQVETGDTLVDNIKGSGLGLSLCRLIVEHYGGKIWVESSLGHGGTFFVRLPGGLEF
ncbi:MAG: cache domain-containing protein [Pseudodesulfovibrio sp.]|nr:cache domain-containing protein [Pseudodesulfovibrio sp.]